jgi:hypothetical protein
MKEGTNYFTKMTAAAFLEIDVNSHSSNPSLFRSANTNTFYFIKIFQNTPQLCWGDEWPP